MHIYGKINYSDRIRNLVLNILGINSLVYHLLQLAALPTFSFISQLTGWVWVRKTHLHACPQSSHPIQRFKEMLLHLTHAYLTHIKQKGLWILLFANIFAYLQSITINVIWNLLQKISRWYPSKQNNWVWDLPAPNLLGVHSATDQIYNIKSSGTWLHILASTVVQFRNRMKGLGWSVKFLVLVIKKKIKFWHFPLTFQSEIFFHMKTEIEFSSSF